MVDERVQRRIDRLLDQIDEAMDRRNWALVRDLSMDVLALDPENSPGRAFLAVADRRLGESSRDEDDWSPVASPEVRGPSAGRSAQPTSFANGRYQVKELLGEGGRKLVYQAHDSVLDRDVALAVIKTEGLDPTSRVRITREAQALGRLGDHPHVLSIHDLGDEAGQPYLVLPLMPGGDIESLIATAEDHRLPLEQAIDLTTQVARGLEFAHSKGIVHRDLKPGNVWLTSDSSTGSERAVARIGDFGLAVAIDRSRLTQEGMMVGTVSYMPPEQAMGGDVTPQSDLYSLGAMLYEMVTGRPPFLGDDSVAIIGQHINTPPVAPTWHNSECPRAMEALIMRMLAKDPGERPRSAKDVIIALEGVDLTVSADEPERDEAHALDSLAGGVFVGRQREMGELKAALEDALSGRGRLVTLVGEPGIGKTRTAEELATYARMRGAQVLWGRCHESRGAPPYWPWVQAIRSYVRERDPERLRSEMGTGATDVAEIVSDVKERIPDLKPAPAMSDPEQARFRLFDSITAFLKTASRSQPLAIILDNLHWADKPSLLLLEFLAQEFADSRLLVVGTYRDVDLSRQHPLTESLGELTRERLFQRVLLRGLTQQDVRRFIEVTSGITPPRGLVEAVHTQTEGNPLFVTEVVRLLVQEGELRQEGSGERDSWDVRIPEGVREVIGRRLNRLSQRCNETLTIASVIGRQFEMRHLAPLIEDISEDRLLEVLEEALAARAIEELPQAMGQYQFTHALIRQTLYDELTTTRRVRLHARIIAVMEGVYGDEVGARAAELAHHAAEAEAVIGSEKVVQYSKLAGERALVAYAYEEASTQFKRALAAKQRQPMDAETAAILSSLGSAQLAANQMADALASLTGAFDHYIASGDTGRALAIAEQPHSSEFIVGMTDIITRAVELVPTDSHQAARILSNHGFALGYTRDGYSRAQEAFADALAIARRVDDTTLEMRTLANSANIDGHHLYWQESLSKSLTAIELAKVVDEPPTKCRAYLWAAFSLCVTGHPDEARSHTDVLVKTAQGLRDRLWLGRSLVPDVSLSFLTGDWEATRQVIDTALEFSPRDAIFVGRRVVLEYQLGEWVAGEAYLERVLEFSGSLGLRDEAIKACVIPLVGRLTGGDDHFDLARTASEACLSSPSCIPSSADQARVGLALMAVERGDIEAAGEQYAVLKSRSGEVSLWVPVSFDRILGLLSHTMGTLDQAMAHFEDALAFCRKAGYRPEFAWSCCDYADMLLKRDEEGDRRKATALLDESLTISSDLGMRPLIERVLSRKMTLQGIDVSSPETSIDAVVSAVEVERPNLRPHAAPDGTVTVMFTDIEGSTAMTERLGDQKAQDVLHIHNAIVREQVAAHQGFEVKSQGDGFMLAFSSARRALECAIAIQQTLGAHNAENPAEPIQVRIGLHTGEAIKEGEDFFGRSVILAARIASKALGGQILVSSLLMGLVEGSGEFGFHAGREVELKGLAGTHQVFEVNLP